MFDNTFLIPAGYISTLTSSADLLNGFYQPLGNPGDAPLPQVSMAAGSEVILGPYNDPKYFALDWTNGSITHAETFGGFSSFATEPPTTADLGTKVGATVTNEDTLTVFKRTKLHFNATPITITDDPGVIQFGGIEIYDFPLGHVLVQCATIVGDLTLGVTGTIIPTFTGIAGLGTTIAVAGATLATTQSDILPGAAIVTAVAKVAHVDIAPLPAIPNSGARWSDGRVTAKKLFLNFKITDDATHTSGTGTFTGDVEFIWSIC